jgi:hypothetical protein
MAFTAFTVDKEQASTGMDVLPEAVYKLMIEKVEDKPNKLGTGHILALTIVVVDGQYKGRKLWENFNYANPNPQAVEIARGAMHALGLKLGIKEFTIPAILNKPFFAKVIVKTEPGKDDKIVGRTEPTRKNVVDFGTDVSKLIPGQQAPQVGGFFSTKTDTPATQAVPVLPPTVVPGRVVTAALPISQLTPGQAALLNAPMNPTVVPQGNVGSFFGPATSAPQTQLF